jgi:hypothetical protein
MRPTPLLLLVLAGCEFVGQGDGAVTSERLVAQDCWEGSYDLEPDFFAGVPFRDTLALRIQRGSELQEVSDGVAVLVNELSSIRPTKCTLPSDCSSGVCSDGTCQGTDQRGQPLRVGLPPKVLNEIAPGLPLGEAPPVSLALYLQFSCHNQNTILYAVEGEITFFDLFNGDPNESEGAEKLTDATFSVMLADPREADPTTLEIPADKKSPLDGWFKFHFQRGQPGQPFP